MDTHNSLLHKTNSRKRSVIFYILFKPEFKYLYMRSMHYIIWMLVPNSSLIWKQDKAKFQRNLMSHQQWRNWSSLAEAHYAISCGHSLQCIIVTLYDCDCIHQKWSLKQNFLGWRGQAVRALVWSFGAESPTELGMW